MRYYRVKHEYWDLWGDSTDPLDYVMDSDELNEKLDDWDLDLEDVWYQLEVMYW